MNSSESHVSASQAVVKTFLFTDVVGSTEMWERAGEVFRSGLELHHRVVRAEIARHGGRELSEAGDGFLIVFESPETAVACAIAIQEELATTHWPAGVSPLGVRMALHSGLVEMREDGEFRGLTLHRAARLRDGAHGGQILCSGAVASSLRETQELRELGLFRLRGVPIPQRVFQVCWPGMRCREFPVPRLQAAFADNLPPAFTRFFGREREIARLRAWVLEHREKSATGGNRAGQLITVTGPGGTGKTRLTLAVAESLLETFSHAVWFVPLADLSDPARLSSTVRDALRLAADLTQDPLEQIVATLSEQPSLLVLDNYEQLGQAGAGFLRALLGRIPLLRCLVSSRQRLSLAGEREFSLGPLPVPESSAAREQLLECESVQLFVDRAQAVHSGFEVTSGNAACVAELCRKLEGVPLALELAAARAHVATPLEMVRQLDRRLDLFAIDDAAIPARHRTLRAAIAWSYEFLPAFLQEFFAQLSIFRGGWTAEAAQAIAGDAIQGGEMRVLGALGDLRASSLIMAQEDGEQMRFVMLETLRQYAAERFAESPTREDCKQRYREFFTELAERAEVGLREPDQARWVDRLEKELDNFRALLAGEAGAGHRFRLASALQHFWMLRGHLAEGREWLHLALEDPLIEQHPRQWLKVRNGAGILAWSAGDFSDARLHFAKALELFRNSGELRNTAGVLNNLGIVSSREGDWEAARTFFRESLETYATLGLVDEQAQVQANLGGVEMESGNLAAARQHLELALPTLRSARDDFALANALHNLGELATREGNFTDGLRHLSDSLAIRRRIRDASNAPNNYESLAEAAFGAAVFEDAVRWLATAEAIREILDASRSPDAATIVGNLTGQLRERVAPEAFADLWREGWGLAREWRTG